MWDMPLMVPVIDRTALYSISIFWHELLLVDHKVCDYNQGEAV